MRIILTNDDGVRALGLELAIKTLVPLGELFVVAPEHQRSACGHAITLHKALRMWEVDTGLPVTVHASNGMPTDCITLAYGALAGHRADLVVAGINRGANLGWDLTYSGTVAAAMEGAVIGLPSIAISIAYYNDGSEVHYDGAVAFLSRLAPLMGDHPLPEHSLLNINCPNVPARDIKGVRVVRQGTRQYKDRLESRSDPWGSTYYWLGGTVVADASEEGTDVEAVAGGYISVTPVHLDLTAHDALDRVRDWLRPVE
jgi:5'-nucleotidase